MSPFLYNLQIGSQFANQDRDALVRFAQTCFLDFCEYAE